MNKDVVFGVKAREKMREGVDTLANAVKVTLGPRGRHAAIERLNGPPLITKDGVTVARYINLSDNIKNMGAQLIKSVASDANMQAGDGTTTATVLAQEIYNRGLDKISEGNNPVLLKRGIDLGVSVVIDNLKSMSLKINDEKTLAHVATISANNDSELGGMIAEAVSAVGNDGLISVEEATGSVTEVIYSDGLKLERGWLDENFVTNPSRYTCEMDDAFILLYDDEIKTIHSLVNIMDQVIQTGAPILIIARDIQKEALAHLVYNKVNNSIRCCVIKAPAFGDYRKAILDDVAVITGAKVYSNSDGQGLSNITLNDLGRAKKVSVGPNLTKIIDGAATQKDIDKEVSLLRSRIAESGIYEDQELVIRSRISRLTGGVAIFKVGGTSEGEMRERRDRVEDAINAVRSAISEGVVPGGGCALLHSIKSLDSMDMSNLMKEEVAGIKIVQESIKAPFFQILKNAGIDEPTKFMNDVISSESASGFDALRLEMVNDMFDRGIIDPVKVVRTSLEHASSASGILLTTEVTISREEE